MATPRYRLSEPTFIKADHTQEAWLHEVGDEIEYSGRPGRNWVPLNIEAERLMGSEALSLMSQNVLPHRGGPPS
jgi:hypothetical protein